MLEENIINLIKENRDNMIDSELYNIITERFPELMFGKAANIDYSLYGSCGRFWRHAYNFPKPGDHINGGEVSICGFFTFNILI